MDFFRLNCMKPLMSRKTSRSDGEKSKTTFTVKYLGMGQLEKPGLKDMCDFVQTTRETTKAKKRTARNVQKRELVISEQELSLQPSLNNNESPLVFRIRRIQFCGVYQVNPKIFFFTYQFGKTADTVDCHVLMCKSEKKAKTLAKEAAVLFKDATFSLHKQLGDRKAQAEVVKKQFAQASGETATELLK